MDLPRKRRPIAKSAQLDVFERDSWMCRWCSRPVIFAPAIRLLESDLRGGGWDGPLALYHAHWTRRDAPLLDELGAVIDHVEAFSSGGADDDSNFVTACNKCNGRKNSAPLDQWGQREIRKPIKGKYGEPQGWDGFASLFVLLARRAPHVLTSSEKDWLRAMQDRAHLAQQSAAPTV